MFSKDVSCSRNGTNTVITQYRFMGILLYEKTVDMWIAQHIHHMS